MHLKSTLGEINAMVGGVTSLDHSFFIEKIASLEHAGPYDLAIVLPRGDASPFDQTSLETIKNSKAGVILTQKALDEDPRYFVVHNVLEAVRTLQMWQKNSPLESSFLRHPSACVDLTAQLHDTVYVGPLAVIERDVIIDASSFIGTHVFIGKQSKIGKNVTIHPGAIILGQTIIEDNSIIHSGTVIGSDGFGYQVNADGLEKIPHLGYVHISRNVEIGANCSIDRAAFEKTFIGTGVKIDNNVHIAHGVHVGDHTAILALTGIAGSARLGIGCQVGGQVAIKDHVVIGNRVKIVSQSAVIKNVNDGEIIAGSPALPLKTWQRSIAAITKLPELFKQAQMLQEKLEKSQQRWWHRFFK